MNRRRLESGRGPVYELRGPGALPLWLWIATALFIVYGTTIPFNFTIDTERIAARLARMPLNPLLAPSGTRRVSIPDAVQNMLLFVPFGVFGVLTLQRRLSRASAIVTTTFLGLVLAVVVESLQLLTVDRTTATADLLTNTLGALAGGIATVTVLATLPFAFAELRHRGLLDVPAFYPMMIAVIVTVVAMCQPFDFTLDVGSLASKVRSFLRDPWQFTVIADEGVGFLEFGLLALSTGLWLRQLGSRRLVPPVLICGAALALGLEGMQALILSRMPGLEDVAVHITGVIAGAMLAERWPMGWPATRWMTLLAVATAGAAAVQALSPFTAAPAFRTPGDFPFLGYYERTTFETLSHVVELVLAYLPFGFCAALSGGGERRWWTRAVVVALAIATPIELAQGGITGRYPDITDIGVSVLGAVSGAWLGGPGRLAFEQWLDAQRHTIEIV